MASGAFFDYTTALRLAPLITASATLTFAGNQQWIFELFTRADLAPQSKTFLPAWFRAAFWIGMPKLAGLAAASALGGVLNLRGGAGLAGASGAWTWYAGGAVLAAAHVLFVPALVVRAEGVVGDGSGEGRCLREMKGWLRVNALRTLTVDAGAWVCFLVAAVKTLGPA
ncbi:hypothetical protein B0T25DRAFT_492720 [Lasiosphaeria hispida]|uniref:Uncharacterized protein n=1 Tax=Lasiosphaeria hispida TaxID=260671 RepID=A0AAJ0HWA0_9PEZI|nr:hypothetical protein B0T25DRAFT_492720 [Lasiosphaeria hispida]